MANYGKHISFPFRASSDGKIKTVDELEAHIRDEIIQLVLTDLGERAFVPDFGGNVKRLVFEGASSATAGIAKATLAQALSRWMGHRVIIETLEAGLADSKIEIELQYKIKGSGERKSLRFEKEAGA